MLTVEKVNEVLEVGMKFSTRTGLVRSLGLSKVTNKEDIERQDRDVARFLEYKKTGKLNRQGKESNEVVITQVYETPLEKVDGRVENMKKIRISQESFYKQYLKELIIESLSELKKDEVDFQGSMYKMLGRQKVFTRHFFEQHSNSLVKQYLLNVGSKIYKPFQSALEELQEENKIKYARVTLYRFEDGEEDLLPDYLVSLYEEAYKFAEKKTGLIPFKKFSFMLSNITAFRAELISYMNKHKEGLYDKDIVNISNPYIIEKGAKFEPCFMPLENKLKLIDNIHNQVLASRGLKEKLDTLEVKGFGIDKQVFATEIFEKCYRDLYYTEEIKQAIKVRSVKEARMAKIEKSIKFHSLHSDLYIAIREITQLNDEYYELTKQDNDIALEFFEKIEDERFYRELEKIEESEEFYPDEFVPIEIKKAIDEKLAYQVWMAQSI